MMSCTAAWLDGGTVAQVVVGLLMMASWSLYREIGRRTRGLRRRPAGSFDVLDGASSLSSLSSSLMCGARLHSRGDVLVPHLGEELSFSPILARPLMGLTPSH